MNYASTTDTLQIVGTNYITTALAHDLIPETAISLTATIKEADGGTLTTYTGDFDITAIDEDGDTVQVSSNGIDYYDSIEVTPTSGAYTGNVYFAPKPGAEGPFYVCAQVPPGLESYQPYGVDEVALAVPTLVFTVEPTTVSRGENFTLTIQAQDGDGNLVEYYEPIVALALSGEATGDELSTEEATLTNGTWTSTTMQITGGSGTDTDTKITATSAGYVTATTDEFTVQNVPYLLYVCGQNAVAAWNGSAWTTLGSSNGVVRSIAIDSSENVYAIGNFTSIGGETVNGVAKYNGTSWSAMGELGLTAGYCIAVSPDDDIYACGQFSASGIGRVAKWSGTEWEEVANGPTDGVCYSLAFDATYMYVAGTFTGTTDDGTAKVVARHNGTAWSAAGTGLTPQTSANYITKSGSTLYLGGQFDISPESGVNVAAWSGASWAEVGNSIGNSVTGITVEGSDLYLCESWKLWKWNGAAWSNVIDVGGGQSRGVDGDGSGNVYMVLDGNIYVYDGSEYDTVSVNGLVVSTLYGIIAV